MIQPLNDLEIALACSLWREGFRHGAGPRFLRMGQRERDLLARRDPTFAAGVKDGREALRLAQGRFKARLANAGASKVESSEEP